jgi:transcription antitermination protein NusB
MSRTVAREMAMKLLYQIDIGKCEPMEAIHDFYENHEGKELIDQEKEYLENCVVGAMELLGPIDEIIERYSKEWKINRIAKVDLSIMRLAIYEMMKRDDIPKAVAVNEAIELGKKFGGENSSAFINGILGNIVREFTQND